jgi:CHAT domain-containing protein/tetratricopeptide (TPR) repeat protein
MVGSDRRAHLIGRIVTFGISIVLSLATIGASLPALGEPAEAIGAGAFAKNDYAGARRSWEAALAVATKRGERARAADLYLDVGKADLALERYPAALAASQAAVRLHRALGDARGEASALGNVAIAEDDLGQYDAAMLAGRQALALQTRVNDRLGMANSLGALGIVEMHLGHNANALSDARRSRTIDLAIGNRRGVADETGRIGIVEEEAGRYDDALRDLGKTLALQRAIGNVLGAAKALNNTGIVEEHLGRYAPALRSETASRELFREIHDRLGEANASGDIGIVDADLGRYGDALHAHEDALAVHHALGDRLGEAEDLTNAGIAAEDLGRYDDALRVLDRALAIERAIRDPLDEANALGNAGIVDEDLGRYEAALTAFQKALAINRKLANKRGEASDLGDVGVVAAALGRADQALEAQEDAYALDLAIGDAPGQAEDLNNVGTLEERAGRYADALHAQRRALAIDRVLPDRLGEAEAYGNISVAEERLGRIAQADSDARRAVALDGALGARESLWRALRAAAHAEARLDRRDDALSDYDRALAQIESLRAGLRSETDRRSFFENKLFVYEEYVAYLCDLDRRFPGGGYDRKALEVFEREQGRAFLEEIGQSSARQFSGVPASVTTAENELAIALDRVDASLLRARGASDIDAAAISARESERDALRERQLALERRIRASYPAYYELTHPLPADPASLQQLLGPGDVTLVYGVLESSTALWVIDRARIRLFVLQGGTDAVAASVGRFLEAPHALEDAFHAGAKRRQLVARANADSSGFSQRGYAFYRWLVPEGARATVDAAQNLSIVPTAALYKVPFEALTTRDPTTTAEPHFLIEDHAVSYLSSASLLAVLRRAQAHRRPARYPLLAFANPDFGSSPQTDAAASARGAVLANYVALGTADTTFPQLDGTEAEARAVIAALAPPQQSHPLYDREAASRANLMRMDGASCASTGCLSDYRYVLFATHAILPDEDRGWHEPALVLAHPERGDGFLTMADVFGLTLDADVVSLSACNTGNGDYTRGDGVRGLTQAFMYAGTPVVSVTLWELSDEAAPLMTPAFYAGLNAGESAASALRAAKLKLLHGDDALLRDPYYWAPVVVFGDGNVASNASDAR